MVSRSLRMIDLTVFLFARFHVNGSREEIWNLAHNPFLNTLVVNSSRFEPDHPEMTTIEIMDLLDNQTKNNSETNNPYETETVKQPLEQTPQEQPTTTLEQTTTSENETEPSIDEAFFQKEQLLLGLASKGWRFRLKEAKGKKYLCTRNDKEEHSIGPFDDKTKTIIEKHKITIQGHNEKQN